MYVCVYTYNLDLKITINPASAAGVLDSVAAFACSRRSSNQDAVTVSMTNCVKCGIVWETVRKVCARCELK